MNARLRGGMFVQGGTSTQRQSTDNCDVVTKVDSPSPLYRHVQGRFLTQIKFMGSFTIPRIDLQVSGNFRACRDRRFSRTIRRPTPSLRVAGP